MKIRNVEVTLTDPEKTDFFEDLTKKKFEQKEVNAEFRARQEKKIDELVKERKEQIKHLKNVINFLQKEVNELKEEKSVMRYDTFFDEKSFSAKDDQIELEILKRKIIDDFEFYEHEERLDLKCQIYEQIKDKLDWLDFETTKQLAEDELDEYFYWECCDEHREQTELQDWFYSQECPIELDLKISSCLMNDFKDSAIVEKFDTLEAFLKEREEFFEARLEHEVDYFYRKISFYSAIQKYSDKIEFNERAKKQIFRNEIEFEEYYNKKKEGK